MPKKFNGWTEDILEKLGKMPDTELSAESGISRRLLMKKRVELGIETYKLPTYLDGDGLKYCPKCDKKKSPSEFTKNKNRWDGLSGYCSPCSVAINKERIISHPVVRERYLSEHNSRFSKYANLDILNMTDEEQKSLSKERRREGDRIRRKRDRLVNPEKHKKWTENWENNPDTNFKSRRKVYKAKSHRKRKAAYIYWSVEDDIYVRNVFQNRCPYCGCDVTENGEFEHFIPISKFGATVPGNCLYSCKECNHGINGKHDIMPLDWLTEKYGEESGLTVYWYILSKLREHYQIYLQKAGKNDEL